MPARSHEFMQGWLDHHPGWKHRLWTDESLPLLHNEQLFTSSEYQAQRADILRYEVLHDYGGVYLDLDMECRRSIEHLVRSREAFIGEEEPGRLAIGIFGARASHPWLQKLIEELPRSWREQHTIPDQTGPGFVTRVSQGRSDVVVFPPRYFYPYSWREPERAGETFPDAYAVHRWQHSWADDEARELERQFGTLAEARTDIESIVGPGTKVLLIDDGEELGLSRETISFTRRDRYWGNPADNAEAIRELERLSATVDWVVFLDAAFWWFDYYSDFTERVAELSSVARNGRRFRAYHLSGR